MSREPPWSGPCLALHPTSHAHAEPFLMGTPLPPRNVSSPLGPCRHSLSPHTTAEMLSVPAGGSSFLTADSVKFWLLFAPKDPETLCLGAHT